MGWTIVNEALYNGILVESSISIWCQSKVQPFIDIINNRWDGQLYRKLYATGFWLNPRCQYDVNLIDRYTNIISRLLDVVKKYANGNAILLSKLTSEMKLFRNAEHDFSKVSARNDRTLLPPSILLFSYSK